MTKELGEILSGEAPAQAEQTPVETSTEPTPQPETQPRAADGKFASKEPNEPTPATTEQQPAPAAERQPGTVPQQALHAAREKVRTAEERAADLERRLAELQGSVTTLVQQRQQTPHPVVEPPKPIEVWDDPNKWGEQLLTPIQQELAQVRFERSFERNVAKHGEEAVEAAQVALRAAIEAGQLNEGAVKAQLGRSRDPIGDLVGWHQQQPASVEARLRAEIEAKVRAELGGQQPNPAPSLEPSPTPVMPSNLVGQRNVGTRSGPAWSGPASINDIFDRSRAKKAG